MADVTPTAYRAFLVPDKEATLWEAETSVVETGPRAGVPAPTLTSLLALGAYGEATDDLDVRIQQQGLPVHSAATVVWKKQSETDAAWRGWDPPSSIQDFESPTWTDGSVQPNWTADPVGVVANDGTMVLAYRQATTGAGPWHVRIKTRAVGDSAWTERYVQEEATLPAREQVCALLKLPSGRLHLYIVIENAIASGQGNIRLYYSDDSGDTWSFGGDVLTRPSDEIASGASVYKLRAAYKDGQVLLLASFNDGSGQPWGCYQYASDDLGLTFTKIQKLQPSGLLRVESYDVVASTLGFVVAFHHNDISATTDGFYSAVFVADAFSPMSSSASGFSTDSEIEGNYGTFYGDGEISLEVSDDGRVWAYYWTAANEGWVAVSEDGGTSWEDGNMTRRVWEISSASGADRPVNVDAVWHRGRMALVANWQASVGNEDASIGIWWLGGYTTCPMPTRDRGLRLQTKAAWTYNWTPIERPSDMGWTFGGTAAVETLTTGRLVQVATAGQTADNTRVVGFGSGSPADGILCKFALIVASGGNQTTDRCAVQLLLDDAASFIYHLSIRFDASGFSVFDQYGGTLDTINHDMTSGAEIMVSMKGGEAQVFYGPYEPHVSETVYTASSTYTLVNGGVGPGTNQVVFGASVTDASGLNVAWHHLQWSAGADVGAIQPVESTLPGLTGRELLEGIFLGEEVFLSPRGGPCWIGEEWAITREYRYGLDKALYQPSPRSQWKGSGTVAIQFDPLQESRGSSPILGIFLDGNAPEVDISLHDGTSWGTPQTAALGHSVSFTRVGSRVMPSTASDLYFSLDELKYATFHFPGGEVRTVLENSEGLWDGTADLPCSLRLSGLDGSEATSGTATLVPPQATVILDLQGADYQGVQIDVPADSTMGRIMVGWVHPIGHDPDWSQDEAHLPQVSLSVADDLLTASKVNAPLQRVRQVSWLQGGIDLTSVRSRSPDLLKGSSDASAGFAASRQGTPLTLAGLTRRLDGPHTPIVYLPRVEGDSGLRVLLRREEQLYGRIEGEVRLDTVVGEELETEVLRVAQITISEEV